MDYQTFERRKERPGILAGFSLLELMTSVAIITILMAAVFTFIFQTQKRFQSSQVISESSQAARAAMELLTQEIGQSGRNPNFPTNKTVPAPSPMPASPNDGIVGQGTSQCVTLAPDISRINLGDWLSFDTGPNQEFAIVKATSTTNDTGLTCSTTPVPSGCHCPGANQVRVILQNDHTKTMSPTGWSFPFPVISYKFPYATGILRGTVNGASTTDDHTLEFYGDINDDAVVNYAVYSLWPNSTPQTDVQITVGGTTTTYTLYNLYRSITSVQFPGTVIPSTNNLASPLVPNVLYSQWDPTALKPTGAQGPTGKPVFQYPDLFTVGISPNQLTVVGTVVVTLCVAVNPKAMESSVIQWYTMATQIRPLNLTAAVAVNQTGGSTYMARAPLDLPMTNPANYYQ